jgi:aspartyl protease family protein
LSRQPLAIIRAMSDPARPSVENLPGRLRWGPAAILAFWLLLGGGLYLAFQQYLQPKAVTVTAQGDLVIPRHRDGHFYVEGSVNGQAIRFLVDTGASSVVVSREFARRARLPEGEPTTFHTANGRIEGRTVRGVAVKAGPLAVSSTTVGVGLIGSEADEGLLGQSFLSRFDMTVSRKQLVLRRPASS